MTTRGIDIRQSTDRILFRSSLKDSSGAKVTSGTCSLRIYELQDDGTLKSYDFNDNTFKTTALTTETQALTHRTGNNGGTNTGLWTYALTTLTGFTSGGVYIAAVTNSNATPETQEREFQFGGVEGSQQTEIWSSASATVNLSGTTIKAVTDAVTVGTNNDKTGYSLSQSFPTNFASLAITAAGKVTVGTNDDKTGYSLSQSFPSNFASLGINASGHISRVTLTDTTTTNTDMITVANIWTTVLTEAYRSTGATGTGAQLLYEILAGVLDNYITGTTKTIRKIDGTTAKTYTLDSSTAPTSITEAT